MARKKNASVKDKNEGSKVLTVLIALLIAIIWLAIFAILIRLDWGGFGSGVLRPILKDVPIINRILPSVSDSQLADENDFSYRSLPEAIARIQELEQELEDIKNNTDNSSAETTELIAEINRLKIFEENQKDFEARVKEFEEEVVFAENAPSIEEYKKFYEAINPVNAEMIYRQVIEQIQYSAATKEKANIYKSMDPKNAAQILQTMTADVEAVAQILLAMKPKESAEILAEMDNVVAAKITKKMLDMDAEKLAK